MPLVLFFTWLMLLITTPSGLIPGSQLPSCAIKVNDQETLHTDSLRGNILLIDFWASWNKDSRIHNQQLIKLYEKYRTQNFRRKNQIYFISISLDTQRDFWLIARAKDNLHWPYNICDLKSWDSEIINALKVEIIPYNYLVDPKGVVVARNIWGYQLDSALKTMNKDVPN